MSASAALPTIHMFWDGPRLSRVERLCMASFLAHGHPLQLHAYEPPTNAPAGVLIVDANATLSRKHMFRDKASNSVAPFADWFRFQVLYDQGGIWADTDMVCLKPFSYPRPEVFGWQDQDLINNAVVGLPPRHALAAWMLECWRHPDRTQPYDSRRTRRHKLMRRLRPGDSRPHMAWGEYGPRGFTQAARHLGYDSLAQPFWHFYPIHYLNWHSIFDDTLVDNPALTDASFGLHLWNEMTRRRAGFDKNGRFPAGSLFERLCARYLKSDS